MRSRRRSRLEKKDREKPLLMLPIEEGLRKKPPIAAEFVKVKSPQTLVDKIYFYAA